MVTLFMAKYLSKLLPAVTQKAGNTSTKSMVLGKEILRQYITDMSCLLVAAGDIMRNRKSRRELVYLQEGIKRKKRIQISLNFQSLKM